MYNEFYGFSAAPFHIIPDLNFLFMSPKHKEALSCMEFGLMHEIGLILITGEIGIGKTTLIRHFLRQTENEVKAASILNTNVTPDQLLTLILQEFGVGIQTSNKAVTIQALQQFLKKTRTQDLHPLLIIDDAQNLSFEALEEVRLLSNLQDGNKALVQIMLVGQPELKAKISSSAMASFSQRIGVNYHLRPLTSQETFEYITHRIRTVGGRSGLFTQAAIDAICNATAGIPRAINQLCDNSLVFGYVDELETIDVQTVKQVIEELGIFPAGRTPAAADQPEENDSQPSVQPPTGSDGASLQDWEHLEARLASIERLLNGYIKELHGLFKSQLQSERNRTDKLLMAYTRIRLKLDTLQKQTGASGANIVEYSKKRDPGKKKALEPSSIVSKLTAIPKK